MAMTGSLLITEVISVAREMQDFDGIGLSHVTTAGAGIDSTPPKLHLKHIAWEWGREYFPRKIFIELSGDR